MKANVPKHLSYSETSTFTLDLQSCRDVDELTIDFSGLQYSWPLGMLIFGASIRDTVRHRKRSGLKTTATGVNRDISAHSYLDHLGFFDFIGLPDKNKIGTARGNARYIPIRNIVRDEFISGQGNSEHMRSEILRYSQELARILAAGIEDYEVNRTMSYAFKETIRNVFEHSGANSCFIAGQRWDNGNVEVAVVDEGCGIPTSLAESYLFESDESALKEAIKPGVSRMYGNEPNENDNSGFGLYVLSEVGKNFGEFVLGSGRSALKSQIKKAIQVDQISFKGTFVGLKLKTAPKDFSSLLNDIVSVGEEEISKLGQRREASKSSKEF